MVIAFYQRQYEMPVIFTVAMERIRLVYHYHTCYVNGLLVGLALA